MKTITNPGTEIDLDYLDEFIFFLASNGFMSIESKEKTFPRKSTFLRGYGIDGLIVYPNDENNLDDSLIYFDSDHIDIQKLEDSQICSPIPQDKIALKILCMAINLLSKGEYSGPKNPLMANFESA